MKRNLTQLMMGIGICGSAMAQTIMTGPSSSQSSYLQPLVASSTITSILTASNAVGGYTMCGLPDGLGAFDNGNGSFTLLMNHEMGNTAGAVHAHGSTGAFISKWVINKSTLAVTSGTDLIQNVYLWTGSTYTTYNAANSSTLAAFTRFCSGDLPAVSAFYNATTGKGTQERIYMNGEESGNEGRAMGHIVTGVEAGNSYELPYLGKASWENYVASPYPSDKTIVVGMDDSTPGQVYVYVGNKSATGTDIVKAGLSGGKLYGVAVLGLLNEGASFPAPNTTFNLLELSGVQNITGATMNTNSNNIGITNFLRPEDGTWDPANPRDFYFITTNAFASPSRMWRLRFTDINNPELGGTITAVLDGTEGQKMMDNLTIDRLGNIMIVEDVGGNIHNGKIWQYKTSTDALTLFAQHDTTRFITGGANFLTIDEEASGIIDAQEILGPGMFLFVDQAHYAVPSPIVEGGQLLALYNHAAALSNPEINVQGNSTSIASGNTVVASTNNTDFGSLNLGSSIIKTFVIQNAGPGVLTLNSFSIGGVNAGDFSLPSPPPAQTTVAVGGTINISVQFALGLLGNRNAILYIKNNDFDESNYTFAIKGNGVSPEINVQGNNNLIVAGNTALNTLDNTDFGTVIYNTPVIKEFVIQNTGTGTLNISNVTITGTNVSVFNFINAPSFPLTIANGSSVTFTVQYLSPVPSVTNTAMINITNNDADESTYSFKIGARSAFDVGIASLSNVNNFATLYPNPANDEVTLKLSLNTNETVTVNVFDILGKKVMSTENKELEKGEREISLNTSSLKNGEYFVQINTSGKSTSIKMVVSH